MSDSSSPSGLPEDKRAEALERLALLQPFLEEGVPLARFARQRDLPLRTLRRWVRQYRLAGLAGLARKTRSDRGMHRRLAPDTRLLIEQLARQTPRPTVASVHRVVAATAEQK